MTLPPPSSTPHPLLATVIADVNAIAGEWGTPAPYFAREQLDYPKLVAAIAPHAARSARAGHRAMADHADDLMPVDYLSVFAGACLLRGIAYGLELASRRTDKPDPTWPEDWPT